MKTKTLWFTLAAFLAPVGSVAAEDPGFEERVVKHDQVYRLLPPKSEASTYRLLVILPGGDGSAEFSPWCQTIQAQVVSDDFVVAQMIAPTWKTPAATWPSDLVPTPEMKLSIDELFAEVVEDAGSVYKIEDGEVYTLSWSSGGPAAYLVAATRSEVKGHFVAMSVFREAWLPRRLNRVRGQRFFLYHSPEDPVCPIALAEAAKVRLEQEGAEVKWRTYSGGHGWAPGNDHFAVIREAMAWMTQP